MGKQRTYTTPLKLNAASCIAGSLAQPLLLRLAMVVVCNESLQVTPQQNNYTILLYCTLIITIQATQDLDIRTIIPQLDIVGYIHHF